MNFFSLFKRKFLYKIKKKINIDIDEIYKENLDDLFYHYGSDKAETFRKNRSRGHGFSKFYANHLGHLRKKEINILEIGSYAGASASAFVKFLPKSTVHCFDINISKFEYESKNIKVYGLDINNEKILNETFKKINIKKNDNFFDLIIDDGSHYLSDILFSLKNFFKYLKKKGIYVIEDFKHPNYYKYNKDVDDIMVDQMLDKLSKKEFFKSNIINAEEQKYLLSEIKKIDIYKGNLKDSDICFIEKI